MAPELLEHLVLLALPVAAHLLVERAVEIAGCRAAAFLDGRDDGLLVGVADVPLRPAVEISPQCRDKAREGERTSTSVSESGTRGSKVPARLTELMLDESWSALTPPDARRYALERGREDQSTPRRRPPEPGARFTGAARRASGWQSGSAAPLEAVAVLIASTCPCCSSLPCPSQVSARTHALPVWPASFKLRPAILRLWLSIWSSPSWMAGRSTPDVCTWCASRFDCSSSAARELMAVVCALVRARKSGQPRR